MLHLEKENMRKKKVGGEPDTGGRIWQSDAARLPAFRCRRRHDMRRLMSRSLAKIALTALAASLVATAAVAQTTVNFASLDGTTNLIAHLSRPEGDAPRPAVVLMHGCSGLLDKKGRILGLYRAWMRALVVQGYVTLTVDSTTSRGFGQTCSRARTRSPCGATGRRMPMPLCNILRRNRS
jgi:dipeptidyl aminopeptidase/acylaminoacyl peptidase